MTIVQFAGLLGCTILLVAYATLQWIGGVVAKHPMFNLANLVGSLLLLWVAIVDVRWGFIILESVWSIVSIPPLLRKLR
jgi:hypothetical protein